MVSTRTVEPPLTIWRLISEACEQLARRIGPPMLPSADAERTRYVAKVWCKHNGKRVAREVSDRQHRLYGNGTTAAHSVVSMSLWKEHSA
jgi:hypothetical protein